MFYAYPYREDYRIRDLIQAEAVARYEKGDRFVDVGKHTLEQAQALARELRER
jgi:hypothetical protein